MSLFYEGRSGRPFSYVYDDDANGDGFADHDLIFVPATRNDVITTDEEWAKVSSFINSDDVLKDARGGIVEAFTAREPTVNQLDLRIAQQIPSVRSQNFEVTLDVLNVLNLLNSDWGQQKYASFPSVSLFEIDGYDDASGKPIINMNITDKNGDGKVTREDALNVDNILSRWQIQLGVRYSF